MSPATCAWGLVNACSRLNVWKEFWRMNQVWNERKTHIRIELPTSVASTLCRFYNEISCLICYMRPQWHVRTAYTVISDLSFHPKKIQINGRLREIYTQAFRRQLWCWRTHTQTHAEKTATLRGLQAATTLTRDTNDSHIRTGLTCCADV